MTNPFDDDYPKCYRSGMQDSCCCPNNQVKPVSYIERSRMESYAGRTRLGLLTYKRNHPLPFPYFSKFYRVGQKIHRRSPREIKLYSLSDESHRKKEEKSILRERVSRRDGKISLVDGKSMETTEISSRTRVIDFNMCRC